jgi:hypothetical protein
VKGNGVLPKVLTQRIPTVILGVERRRTQPDTEKRTMNAPKLTAEQLASLRAEMVAWEMGEARIYGEPMDRAAAAAKVDAGLTRFADDRR